ncbi:MAG TPA: hypothetical protein VF640_00290, partial [Acidimicrobiales bacterium]
VAIPEYVPRKPAEVVRTYESPPWQPEWWLPDRPGDLLGHQPAGPMMGSQGPDQGYAFLLARQFKGRLRLQEGEREEDAVAGCLGVATKRAALFGRAPVVHDLTVAFTVWGFLDEDPPAELVAARRPLFAEVASPHHYDKQRAVADAVPEATLRRSHRDVAEVHGSDWRSLLSLAG